MLDGGGPLDVVLDRMGWDSPGASGSHLLCCVEMAKLQNEAKQRHKSRSDLIVLISETLVLKFYELLCFL